MVQPSYLTKGSPLRSLFRASIWAPGAIPEEEEKYRSLKTVMFPVIDILFILGGFSAARHGIPAISEFFDDSIVDLFSYLLSFAAFLAFVGIAFPSQWRIEIMGKSVIFGLISAYISSLLVLTLQGEDNRGFVLFVAAVAICPVAWRMGLIGSEWRDRRVDAAKAKTLVGGE